MWTRAQAIADVLDASDGAYGRVTLWFMRPFPLQKCARWGCNKRFPPGRNRLYHSARCREAAADMRHRRRRR